MWAHNLQALVTVLGLTVRNLSIRNWEKVLRIIFTPLFLTLIDFSEFEDTIQDPQYGSIQSMDFVYEYKIHTFLNLNLKKGYGPFGNESFLWKTVQYYRTKFGLYLHVIGGRLEMQAGVHLVFNYLSYFKMKNISEYENIMRDLFKSIHQARLLNLIVIFDYSIRHYTVRSLLWLWFDGEGYEI